jgi:parvulin-like peptidyl-prolyl isomerase/putative cell wall-binding protein
MKKTKKVLASLAIAGMALTMLPFNAFAESVVPNRLAGTTAEQTAVGIADQTGWTGTAILSSSTSYGMVDALTAGPLAFHLKAPILLTGTGVLDTHTKAELTKLAVKTVFVTSGTAVISQGVLDELKGMGITIVPLGGVDKYETSVNIANKMVGVTKVAVANGLQDALSIAAIAAAANQPILLTGKEALPASVAAYLAANRDITRSDVIGGTGVISEAVETMLPNATRHAGNDAYDTNNQIIQDFNSSLAYGNVYVANGGTGIDALAGAPLAALTKSAIILTDGTLPEAATFVRGELVSSSVVTSLGGVAVVPEIVRSGVVTGVVELSVAINDWAVKVNGESILIKDYDARVADAQKTYEILGLKFDTEEGKVALPQIKTQLLDRMIEGELIAQEVKSQNLDPEDTKVKEQEDTIKNKIGDEEEFQDTLKRQGMTEAELKNFLTVYEKVTADIKVLVESDIKAFFDKNVANYSQLESVKACHILVKTEDEAKAMITQLEAGADFAQLAKDNSIEPGAKQSGGDLGTFTKGKMVPEFETAAFAQEVGKFSITPVKTAFGYHVILVEAHTAAVEPDYTKVKAQVEQDVLNQAKDAKFQTYFENLRKKAKIEYSKEYQPAG